MRKKSSHFSKKSLIRKTQILLVSFIIFCFSLYLLFGMMLYFFPDRVLFHVDNDDFLTCNYFQNYTKQTFNNTRFYSRERNDTGKVIVYYHGNGGSACDRGYLAWRFERQRTSLLFVEYTGYANDTREPSKEALLQNARDIDAYLQTKHYNETIIIGESLGTAIASYQSTLGNTDKLVLIAPFYSNLELLRSRFLYPGFIFRVEEFKNYEYLQNYDGQLAVIHGRYDMNIPIEDAYKLYFGAPTENKRFYEIEYAAHNDLYRYWDTYRAISDTVEREDLPVLITEQYRVS